MKILARILIILAVAALVTVAIVAIVNSNGSNAAFSRNGFQPQGEGIRPLNGSRPDGLRLNGNRFEGRGGGGWMFGLIKNVGVIAVLVALIVIPKSLFGKRKKMGKQQIDPLI